MGAARRGAVPVAFHLGDSGYNAFAGAWGAARHFEAFGRSDALGRLVVSDRAIHDTIGILVVHGVFQRHPKLRVASIENGSDWLHLLVKRLRKLANQTPSAFPRTRSTPCADTSGSRPYLEEDLRALADLIGVERILFGSDWPHGEGVAQPLDFAKELAASARPTCGASCATTASSCSGRPRELTPRSGRRARRTPSSGRGPAWLDAHWNPDLTVDAWWRLSRPPDGRRPHFTPDGADGG